MNNNTDIEPCVDEIIKQVGKKLVVGLPLGLGKPAPLINALYARAKKDTTLSLTICTALSLEIPAAKSELERRFLEPFAKRYFDGVPELDYARDRRAKKLPDNVEVIEFYFSPGALLGNEHAQQNYISSNYTHAAR
ncbi:MAG TPA: acetyl-CoA hydrolase, partial [Gammaproteobacteria bacterium]|nr:acetyl-CoA hydrolase [Gammaproteobacteria bacterium]